ncbi:MAG: AraC family transcriptional regulator [Nevskiaceae bacterium]|nr:MAG: AraC family transcriptional regulator [Nevskiaceae bacterium]TBR74604.1 MAG: AraC family transcriptional regulator [Nevskiaceae bacterium]
MRAPVTIEMEWVRRLVAGVVARGEPCARYLAEVGIAPALLAADDARVTGEQYALLFRLLIERREDEALGFLSRRLRRGSFALTARSALGAASLGVAIRHAGHTLGLLQDDFQLRVRRQGKLAAVVLHFMNVEVARSAFVHEMLLRVYWELFVWLGGGHVRAIRFDFAYPGASKPQRYGGVFRGPIRSGCDETAVWFDAVWLNAPVRRDARALRAYLADAETHVILPQRFDERVSGRVRTYLDRQRPVWPDLAATAGFLHMSTATLQRRLAAERTSFLALKNEFRRDVAMTRLSTSRVSVVELAQELGFSDATTFQRAFKGWTGRSPGAYREDNAIRVVSAPR